jgi:hypothetical protein
MRKPPMLARLVAVGACVLVLALAPAARADDDADEAAPRAPDAHAPAPAPDDADAPRRAIAAPATPPPPLALDAPVALRAPGDELVLIPTARLQVDGAFFPRQSPKSGAFIRRARVGLAGWLARIFYFDVSVDFTPTPPGGADTVAPAALSPTDDYLALAPFGDLVIVQAGQFDVPFTLANRISDAYTDFIERPMSTRLLGAPRNKDVGGMISGLLGDILYYSAGIFDGEGPGFRPLDNQPDIIGRFVASPFGLGLRRLSIGGSAWYGRHVAGPMFSTQATPGGVRFFSPQWTTGQVTPLTMQLREQGLLTAYAAEVNFPITRRFGLRAEGVYKRQQLVEADVSLLPAGPIMPVGGAFLEGLSGYGELWFWLLGDESLLPAPGFELPVRAGKGPVGPFDDGVMIALRGEVLKEDLTTPTELLVYGDPNRATTRVVSGTAGVNYWRGRLVRFSVNYVINYWSGTSESIKIERALGPLEHEILLRFAMSVP